MSLRATVEAKSREIERVLERHGLSPEPCELTGSLSVEQGTFLGEVDLIVRIGEPLNEATIERLEAALRTSASVFEASVWGEPRIFADFTLEIPVGSDDVTLDLHVTQAPFVPVSRYRSLVFSSDELAWLDEVRRIARERCSPEAYREAKTLQTFEAAWRICAALALHRLDRGAESPLPKGEPEGLERAVTLWLDGECGSHGLDRPASLLPYEIIRAPTLREAVPRVAPPAWTVFAEKMQLRAYGAKSH